MDKTSKKIEKVRSIQDEAIGKWFDVFRVRNLAGNRIEIEVPRGTTSLQQVLQLLLDRGAALDNSADTISAIQDAKGAKAPVYIRSAQTGWRDNFETFVTQHGAAGKGKNVLPPKPNPNLPEVPELVGDLQAWKQLISVCQYSTSMLLALCVVFAAPLIRLLARSNFTIVLVADSRSGKSTAQMVAGSVLGFRTEEQLPTLDATDAGLRALAFSFNDHPLLINEVATARGKKSDVYSTLLGGTYALMSGRDTMRHPSWSEGHQAGTFNTIGLMSSEHSPDTWAGRAGEIRDNGEKIRLISVPVSLDPHGKTFDQLPADLSPEERARKAKHYADTLKMGFTMQAGTAWPAYLEKLIENRNRTLENSKSVIQRFEQRMSYEKRNDLERDIISKFAVLAAGGVIATRAKILPFSAGLVANAVERSCEAALRALPNYAADLDHDLSILREMLGGPTVIAGPPDQVQISGRDMDLLKGADGIKYKHGAGQEFIIRSESLVGWFNSLNRVQQLLEWLDDEGYLQHARARKSGRSVEWAQSQAEWYRGHRPRSINIVLPKGLRNLQK